MSEALWRAAIDTLQRVEGGYVMHPDDPGGETNYGISKRAYPHLDIANLTKLQAAAIAKVDYWEKLPAGLPDDLRWMAFDAAFHHGVGRALQWLRDEDTLEGFTARRVAFLANLDTFSVFGRGWTRRIATVLGDIAKFKREHGETGQVNTLVLHNLRLAERWAALATGGPSVIRGTFFWRARSGKLDLRRED